jgi:transposase InsO family protein
LNYDIYDKELLAIVDAMRGWKVYLEGATHQIQVLTDHKNLIYFTTTKELNRRQVRWYETLATFNFKISYVAGSENARADALSRKPEYLSNKTYEEHTMLRAEGDSLVLNQRQLASTSATQKTTLEQGLREAYAKDPVVARQKKQLESGFAWTSTGILTFQERVYIPTTTRTQFVREFHGLPAHGHQGIARTLSRLSREYYFPGMRKVVKEVVTACDTCIRNKASRHAPYGLMKSPATPPHPWKSIALDFVTELPPSRDPVTQLEYNSICVITDRTTKYAYMVPCLGTQSASDMAQVFLRTVFANHGTPEEIISDRDTLFTSKFWTTFFAILGVKQKMSTAFHPQTDAQTERINQTMETYLRCYVNYRQNDWVQLLPLAQFAYNSADQETIGVSPFYANYGYNPTAYQSPIAGQGTAHEAILQGDQLRELHKELATDIQFIAQKSAAYYNTKRSVGPTLKEGDRVYLLRKNIQTKRPSQKLDHKKLGPFRIAEVRGPVNFRLALPKSMNIHPVFHISLLEPAPPGAPPAPTTGIQPINPNAEYEVESILDCQYIRKQVKYLIKWKDYPHSDNTWEPRSHLQCPELLASFHRQNPGLPRKQDQRNQARALRPRGSRRRRQRTAV